MIAGLGLMDDICRFLMSIMQGQFFSESWKKYLNCARIVHKKVSYSINILKALFLKYLSCEFCNYMCYMYLILPYPVHLHVYGTHLGFLNAISIVLPRKHVM